VKDGSDEDGQRELCNFASLNIPLEFSRNFSL